MENTFLKELAFEYVLLLDRTLEERKELVNFVESASDTQIKSLLLSEGVAEEYLSEDEQIFVEHLFAISPLGIALSEVGGGVGAALYAASTKPVTAAIKGKEAVTAAAQNAQAAVRNLLNQLPSGSQVSQTYQKYATSTAGQVIGAIALAALVALVARKVYKAKFSQAAKACKGAADKAACMKKAKAAALQAQAAKLQGNAKACGAAKDPAKCKAAIAKKVAMLKQKASA